MQKEEADEAARRIGRMALRTSISYNTRPRDDGRGRALGGLRVPHLEAADLRGRPFFSNSSIAYVESGLVDAMYPSDVTASEVPRPTFAPTDSGTVDPVAREKAVKIAQDELARRGDTGSRFKSWTKDGAMRFGCHGRRECLASDHVHDRREKVNKKTGKIAIKSGQDFLLRVASSGDLVFICFRRGQKAVPLLRMPEELRLL